MKLFALGAVVVIALAALVGSGQGSDKVDPLVARGRYLVGFGSCNDCHTPGWRESDGTIPVARWMTGSNLGYRGPWGTSYPANVRLEFQRISEADWLFMVRTRGGHWPMVWHDLRMLRQRSTSNLPVHQESGCHGNASARGFVTFTRAGYALYLGRAAALRKTL